MGVRRDRTHGGTGLPEVGQTGREEKRVGGGMGFRCASRNGTVQVCRSISLRSRKVMQEGGSRIEIGD